MPLPKEGRLLNNKLHNEAQKEEFLSLNREREGNFEDPSQVENQRNEKCDDYFGAANAPLILPNLV